MPPETARLNLGCGDRPQPGFVNVDLHPHPGVIAHDLRRGIPFADDSFDLVYHSTMLSHFRRSEAVRFMQECRRVLRPGGILRVVTEDLEQLCRVYLQKLEAAWNGDRQSGRDHEWLVLEMYDQAMRERPGGEMAAYLTSPELPNEAFILQRVGEQGAVMLAAARSRRRESEPVTETRPSTRRLLKARLRKLVLTSLLGDRGDEAYDIGRFRLSAGSSSYWFYDRYSLRELFRAAGFADISLRTPEASGHMSWPDVNLDLASSGAVARPHTLIMEGVRARS